MRLNPPKILIVCSEVNDNLESQLASEGWVVNWVYDAETAIAKLRRERFDLAVLMSTGKKMDEMETFFNLKDIQKTLRVIAVRRPRDTKSAHEGETSVPPNSGLRSVQGLEGLLSLLNDGDLHRSAGRD